MHGRYVSVFLDGVGDDGTPVLSDILDAAILDMNLDAIVKVGQRLQGWLFKYPIETRSSKF